MLKFKQSNWMKKYIDFNTEKRMHAANDQFCFWKNNAKFTKKNQCEISQ